ncbi:MAG: GerMN domain-containing protein [Ilumatobacteraceae bacterium]|nr:GerMN domain-containing protein [Ilumatobacteraceae bacterium]
MNQKKRVLASLATVLGFSACGLQTDSEAVLFDDVPYGLAETSTSTTAVLVVNTGPNIPTTTVAIDQREVEVVFVRRLSRELESINIDLPIPVSSRDIIDQLTQPPPDAEPELQTEVSERLVLNVQVDRGLATVNLSRTSINQLGSAQQRRAIAQIVLTLTLFTSEAGGIGQVEFLVGGQPTSVYVPLLNANNEPGEPVAWADFAQLLVGVDAPPTTTTTTTEPPSTNTTAPATPPSSTSSTTIPATTGTSTTTTSTTTPSS